MNKKNKPAGNGIIYSTDPNFRLEEEESEVQDTMPANQQKLKIRLDTKQRAGKAVTLVDGFIGKEDDLQQLGKTLKNFCGTGGSVKDNQVIIQGDQRDKVLQWLQKNNYTLSKRI